MVRLVTSLFAAGLALTALAHADTADERFKALYEKEWTWRQEQFPGQDDEDRESKPTDNRLTDVGAAAQDARLKYWSDVLKQLDAIPVRRALGRQQVNIAIYRPQIENFVAGIRFRDYEMPFNSDSQFWSDLGFMTRRPLKDAQAVRNYTAKLDDVPRYFDQQIANMRDGLKRGFTVPRAVLDGRDVSIASYAEAKSPEESEFYAPYKKLPSNIPADEQAKLRADGVRAIREHVIPAYAKLLKFFRDEYLAACAQDARRRSAAGRQGVLPPADQGIHDARSGSGGDPRDRAQGSRAHRCGHAARR